MPFIENIEMAFTVSSFQPRFGFVSMLASLRGDIYGAGETREWGFSGIKGVRLLRCQHKDLNTRNEGTGALLRLLSSFSLKSDNLSSSVII